MLFRIYIAICFLGYFGVGHAQRINSDNNDQVSLLGIRALAILQTLNADLLASKSATKTLQSWCESHHMATEPKIIALRDSRVFKEPDEMVRNSLKVSDAEPVMYRRVQLVCGHHVLSHADNWYVPSRLTDYMNALLTQTDMPFGAVVRPLNFYRQTEKSTLLWDPLPKNWDQKKLAIANDDPSLNIPEFILEHQAILLTDKNIPFSAVVETYTKHIFSFPMDGE